jgi:hypothetical protein
VRIDDHQYYVIATNTHEDCPDISGCRISRELHTNRKCIGETTNNM